MHTSIICSGERKYNIDLLSVNKWNIIWNMSQNIKIYIYGNTFEDIFFKMRPFCLGPNMFSSTYSNPADVVNKKYASWLKYLFVYLSLIDIKHHGFK